MTPPATDLLIVVIEVDSPVPASRPINASVRAALNKVIIAASADVNLPLSTVRRVDHGAGVVLLVPGSIDAALVAGDFMAAMNDRLVGEPVMRLRVALDRGGGPSTDQRADIRDAASLAGESRLRAVLGRATRSRLALIVSPSVYLPMVESEADGIEPASFAQIDLLDGLCGGSAFIHVPGYPSPPGLPAPARPDQRETAPEPVAHSGYTTIAQSGGRIGIVFNGPLTVRGNVINGDKEM